MLDFLPYPNINGDTTEKKLAQINNYLVQFKEAIEFALMGMSSENQAMSQTLAKSLSESNDERTDQMQQVSSKMNSNVDNVTSTIEQTAGEIRTEISKALEAYSTTNEMNSAITQRVDSITLEVNESISNLQQQIDGAVETFSGSEVPTLNNKPAVDWTTDAIRNTHIGDLYLVSSDNSEMGGSYYRFERAKDKYQWVLLKDNEIAEALAMAEEANRRAQELAEDLANNYSTTIDMHSAIEQKANSITLSVGEEIKKTKTYADTVAGEAETNAKSDTDEKLKSYSTTTEMNSAIALKSDNIVLSVNKKIEDTKKYADTVAGTAEQNANNSTNDKLKEYSKTTEMNSAITQKADEINLSVSKQISDTKSYADTVASNAEANAKTDTNERLKSYSTTTQMNSAISQKADEINLSVGQQITETKSYAEGLAGNAETNAKNSTDEKLKSYSTTTQMNSAITQKANEINSSVSLLAKDIVSYADDVANSAKNDANKSTDEKLKSYSTTKEMNSAISQKADEINLSVSNTLKEYSTTTQMNSAITQKADEINLEVSKKVGSDEVVSVINQSPDTITLRGNRVIIESDKFALNKNGSAIFTNSGQIWIPPTSFDVDRIRNVVMGKETVSGNLLRAMDFNCDGKITLTDFLAGKSILLGKTDVSYYVETFGYQKQYSTVTLRLQPENLDKTILISGTNSFGTYVESHFGLASAKTETLLAEGANIGKLYCGEVETSSGNNLDDIATRLSSLEVDGQETGSNSNGEYYKFADGTLICTKTVSVSTAINVAWGSMYENSDALSLGNWSCAFTAPPIVTANCANNSAYNGGGKKNAQLQGVWNVSTTSAGETMLLRPASTGTATYIIHVIGVGRWK